MSSRFPPNHTTRLSQPSFPRRRESRLSKPLHRKLWIPAFAGMTAEGRHSEDQR